MAEPFVVLTAGAGKLLGEMADEHRRRLPDAGRRTRRVPPTASAGTTLAIITEIDYITPVAIHRGSHPCGFAMQRITPDDAGEYCDEPTYTDVGEPITAYADLLFGVHYTGSIVEIRRIAGRWQIVTTGAFFWGDAVSQAAFADSGPVELFAAGPIVTAVTDTSIAASTLCDVNYDDQAQQFKITAQRCPPVPE